MFTPKELQLIKECLLTVAKLPNLAEASMYELMDIARKIEQPKEEK